MKKCRKCGILALCLTLFLCGCGAGEKKDQKEEQASLTFMMPQSHAKDFLLELVEEYEAETPQVKLEIQRIPDDQWIDLVHSKAAVGEMPDIIRLDKWVLEAVGTKHFVEFDEETPWYSRVLPGQLNNKLIDGKLYGLPIASTSAIGLVYNKDIFDKYHLEVPGTIEELYTVCEALKKEGIIPLYASDKDAWTIQVAFNCMVMQATDEATLSKLQRGEMKWADVKEYHEILKHMKAFREKGYTNENYMEVTYDSAVEAMAEGKAAMYPIGQFFIKDVQRRNAQCSVGMAPFPYNGCDKLSVISGAGMFAVCRDSEYVKEAEDFLEWFSEPAHMNKFNKGWNHPPVFKEQNLEMDAWQQEVYDRYITPGRTVLQIDEILNGVNLNGLWNSLKEMLAGRMNEAEVLESWDKDFAEQMNYRQGEAKQAS